MRTLALVAILTFCNTARSEVHFQPTASTVDVHDFVEIAVHSTRTVPNPFLSPALHGVLHRPDGVVLQVDGFVDSPDGTLHRIRFLATLPGRYTYELTFEDNGRKATHTGAFTATNSRRKGLLAVDPDHPFHFQWSGTKDHYFWNGLTTYALLGWKDDAYIAAIIDRAAQYKMNRFRVTLVGPRVADAGRWYEPLKPSSAFQFLFGPWQAASQAVVEDPQWDVTRFDTAFFQKAERAIRHARERDVVISVVFFLDGADKGADPFGKANMFGEDIRRYYRYVNARLGAYSNVTWDVTNEWHLFRNAWWVEQMGTYLKSIDPYKHLISSHGRGDFPWALSQWPDMALYQLWDESGGYEPMLKRRTAQRDTGRPLPQINEEYGYEDTYPAKWGGNRRPPARNADSRRRLAWEIAMAGCYQTTGEKASRNGDGAPPATPGGWINGGYDDSMTMLDGYRKLAVFFEAFPYWELEPVPSTAQAPRILAAPQHGRYVIYLSTGGKATIPVPPATYRLRRYDPRNGTWTENTVTQSEANWTTPGDPNGPDVAYLLERK